MSETAKKCPSCGLSTADLDLLLVAVSELSEHLTKRERRRLPYRGELEEEISRAGADAIQKRLDQLYVDLVNLQSRDRAAP
jgi:hypothetical protein